MKMCRSLFAFFALALPLVAAEKADITLSSGQVLKAARIVSIGPKEVSIMHAGGLVGVAPEDVPLDVLARAHMDFEAKKGEREKQTAEIAARDAARRTPEGVQSERVNAIVNAPFVPKLSPTRNEQSLIDFKAKFPAQRTVKIRSGEVLVPSVDVYRAFKSEIQVATLQSLPLAIANVEKRMEAELARVKAGNDVTLRSTGGAMQSWIEKDLRPYLKKLKEVR